MIDAHLSPAGTLWVQRSKSIHLFIFLRTNLKQRVGSRGSVELLWRIEGYNGPDAAEPNQCIPVLSKCDRMNRATRVSPKITDQAASGYVPDLNYSILIGRYQSLSILTKR